MFIFLYRDDTHESIHKVDRCITNTMIQQIAHRKTINMDPNTVVRTEHHTTIMDPVARSDVAVLVSETE